MSGVCSALVPNRSFFFPRGVEHAKGVFIGNFPAASEGDSADFFDKVPFLNHDATVADAAVLLAKYDVGAVPVLQRHSKELVGMFSERDIARAVSTLSYSNPPLPDLPPDSTPVGAQSHHKPQRKYTISPSSTQCTSSSTTGETVQGGGGNGASSSSKQPLQIDFHQLRVEDIMSHRVISIVQGTSLSEALMIMDQNNLRHLPVVSHHDPKRVVGLLSMRDIMHRHIRGEAQATTEDFMQWVLKMSK